MNIYIYWAREQGSENKVEPGVAQKRGWDSVCIPMHSYAFVTHPFSPIHTLPDAPVTHIIVNIQHTFLRKRHAYKC